jgi:hypothetical protein
MTAREEILSNKHDILKLKADKKLDQQALADKLFENFVIHARANWKYAAQPGAQKALDALNGTGTATLACGTIREALKIMFLDELNATAANEDINSYFLSKPGLKNFDSLVTGNVFDETGRGTSLACLFSTHYFLKLGTKWYDPCMTSQYVTREGPVHAYTKNVGVPPTSTLGNLKKAGSGTSLMLFLLDRGRSVPGFGSVWKIVKPRDLKTLLPNDEYAKAKLDPDLKAAGLK